MIISNLTYKNDGATLFSNLNYSFEKGRLYGIMSLRPGEATALLKLLGGILTPQEGSVKIEGIDVHSTDPQELKDGKGISAFIFERLGLISNLNIRENLLLPYNHVFPDISKEEKLEKIGLYFEKFKLNPHALDERPAKLNAQTYKLIVLIRGFIINPKVILYDMPFTDLEVNSKKALIEEITLIREREESLQVFYSNTDVLFDRADKALIFQDGEIIAEGTWEELFINEEPAVRKIITNYLSIGLNEIEI